MKRGRNQRRRQGVNPNRALDSNGPDVRIRGTANQIYDKYTALARDASSSGDRIKAENYLQHAEHYFRVIRSVQQSQPQQQPHGQSDAESDQPAVDDSEEQPRKPRRTNGRDRGAAEEKADDADNGEETTAVKASDDAEASDEEAPKKPRRRRVKRATAEDADAGKDEEKAPAAAE